MTPKGREPLPPKMYLGVGGPRSRKRHFVELDLLSSLELNCESDYLA
jgi:hypothetical protein